MKVVIFWCLLAASSIMENGMEWEKTSNKFLVRIDTEALILLLLQTTVKRLVGREFMKSKAEPN